MNAMRKPASNAAALYLRLPARADLPATPEGTQQFALPFALAVRGRLYEQGVARIETLSEAIRQSQRIVLLFAASDVTVMRISVPPLPAHRLRQALPALVEDRIIGDPADCAIAAGPENDGFRTIAVVDSGWLQRWMMLARRLGARRLSALPLQLCLPASANHVLAWLSDFPQALPASRELVMRLGESEAAGLPLDALGALGSDASPPADVLNTALAMSAGRPLQLFVPQPLLPEFAEALATRQTAQAALPSIELHAISWEDLIDAAAQSEVDLIAGIAAEEKPAIDWQRWRLPAALALVLLLLNVFALNGDWWRLHQEGTRLEGDMLRAYRSAFPDDAASDQAVMADPVSRMKQRRITQSRAAGEPSPGDFLWLSAALGDAWPAIQQATGLDARAVASIEYRDAGLLLRFRPGNQPSIAAVRRPLAERQLEIAAGSEPDSWRVQSAR